MLSASVFLIDPCELCNATQCISGECYLSFKMFSFLSFIILLFGVFMRVSLS